MSIFIYSILCYGITNIMVFSHFFKKWRNFWTKVNPEFLGKLFTCPMCLSLWIGMGLTILFLVTNHGNISPLHSIGMDNDYITVFLDGCYASGIVWLIHTLQEKLEYRE